MTILVFYDGKCGLCRREIAHYQRIAPTGVFTWVDITVTPEPFTGRGFALQDGLRALHVEDASGHMHTGVGAFAVIWQHLPRLWPWLAYLVGLPIVRRLADRVYARFAAWRFRKLGYDQCAL